MEELSGPLSHFSALISGVGVRGQRWRMRGTESGRTRPLGGRSLYGQRCASGVVKAMGIICTASDLEVVEIIVL